jgi:hypothetical protein
LIEIREPNRMQANFTMEDDWQWQVSAGVRRLIHVSRFSIKN